jgi:hypothetical protein
LVRVDDFGVVLVCHVGGVLGYFGVVVNTPRKLHSAGPTNRDYPTAAGIRVFVRDGNIQTVFPIP